MTERLHARPGMQGRVGTVLQAYLYRTADDAKRLVEQGIRIRLCKGAYKEPAEIAFPEKRDVDENYVALMTYLATSGVFCGMATHDERSSSMCCGRCEASMELPKNSFEFQMLYGIRRDLQRSTGCTKDTGSGSTCRSGRSGIRTLCGGWRNGRRMCCFWRRTSSRTESLVRWSCRRSGGKQRRDVDQVAEH